MIGVELGLICNSYISPKEKEKQRIEWYNMDLIDRALEFEQRKMKSLSTSDRVALSREAKELILGLNEIYKQKKDTKIMDLMKRLTVIKQRVEKRLKLRM